MIFLPTRNRAKRILEFIQAYKDTEASEPICLIFDPDDVHRYDGVQFPDHWVRVIAKEKRQLQKSLEDAWKMFPNDSYYGICTDDGLPRTKHWDKILKEAAEPHYIAWPDDGIHKENLSGFFYIGGDLVRALGWFIPPYTKRGYTDFIWLDFARTLKVDRYCGNVLMEHMHWQIAKAPMDATYATQPSEKEDQQRWFEYRSGPQFQEDIKRAKEALGI